MAFMCVDFQKFLDKNYQDKVVAVEFECGDCCKKATGILSCIAPNFIRLVSNPYYHPFVRVRVFCGDNTPEEECAKEIVIKNHNIVAVELCPDNDTCPIKEYKNIDNDSILGTFEQDNCNYINVKDE